MAVSMFLFLLFLRFLSLNAGYASSGGDTISRGQSLTGNQTIVSKESHFELGFFSPGTSNKFYIGIWYKKVSPHTVIWVANREASMFNTSSWEFKLDSDGNLVLLDRKTTMNLWSSNSSRVPANSTTVAVLLDTGNLVLRDHVNSSVIFWQSFDYPTDTLVPGGWVGMNKITGEYQRLTSWRNSEDPAPGLFTDTIDPSGLNQFLTMWNGTKTYWRSGVWNGQEFVGSPGMNANPLLVTNFTDNNEKRVGTQILQLKNAYARYVMEPSGQHKQWLWTSESQTWMMISSQPLIACEVYSYCGAFGVCDQSRQGFCYCPPGFEPASVREWALNPTSTGCRRKTRLYCNSSSSFSGKTQDGFLAMEIMTLPDESQILTAGDAQECELACLNSCSCNAYSYVKGCFIWNGDIRNLRSQSNASTIYIRLAASDMPMPGEKKSVAELIIISCSVGTMAAVLSIILAVVIWRFLRRKRKHVKLFPANGVLVQFKYTDLRRMTNNFSNILGQGGFGSVFKGAQTDSTVVAVKQLNNMRRQEKSFRAEVMTLGRIHHINLIPLLGFCCNGTKRLLVYDYMPNSSLDHHLFNKDSSATTLDWKTRFKIIVGVAKGLEYLHEKCRDYIIHCDVKPENILLDSNFCPKVADFGLAKLFEREFSRVLTTRKGTIGYLAPEWIAGLPITTKADVYSYGKLLFELISGRRNKENNANRKYFPVWAAGKVIEGDVLSLLDENLGRNVVNIEELNRVCRVACWCIQDREADRPSMGLVVLILEGVVEVGVAPIPVSLQKITDDTDSSSVPSRKTLLSGPRTESCSVSE